MLQIAINNLQGFYQVGFVALVIFVYSCRFVKILLFLLVY